MSKTELLHGTMIEEPGFLDVGIRVETYLEEIQAGDVTYYLLFTQSVTWMGFSDDIKLTSGRSYMQGQMEGLHQVVKIEFPDREKALVCAGDWHKIGCITAEQMKPQIKAATLMKLAASL